MRDFSALDVGLLPLAARWTLLLSLVAFGGGGLLGLGVTALRISRHAVLRHLGERGHAVHDAGSHDDRPVDFPDIARAVTARIQAGDAERGLLVCGTGVGACIAANKVAGIRTAVCHDLHSAHQSVEHDDVNLMCIGAQIVGPWLAMDLIDAFLGASFSTDEGFRRRVRKLHAMDERR